MREAFSAIKLGKETGEVELELRRKDNGAPVWVQWWSRPAPGGHFTRTMMVDITDRVRISQTKTALEFSLESGLVGDWDLDIVNDTSRRSLRHDQCFGYSDAIPEADWVREGLAAMIGRQPDMLIVAEAATGRDAVDLWRLHRPDVALLDLRVPVLDGVGAVIDIRQSEPSARIVVLTTFDSDHEISRAIKAGASRGARAE